MEVSTQPKTEEEMEKEIEEKIKTGNHLKNNECLFCRHTSEDLLSNLKHMEEGHGFFIPDREYLENLPGLITFLAQKVSIGYICLYCNNTGKLFHSLGAVRNHMQEKSHCKLAYEEEDQEEYLPYYDFSKQEETQLQLASEAPRVSENGYEMVLKDGKRVGHRSLAIYYKQNLRPINKKTALVNSILHKFKALTYEKTVAGQIQTRAHREYQQRKGTFDTKLGRRANLLQNHFRDQNSTI